MPSAWRNLRENIDATSEAGFTSVITFSGFRRGIDIDEGQKNMVEGLEANRRSR